MLTNANYNICPINFKLHQIKLSTFCIFIKCVVAVTCIFNLADIFEVSLISMLKPILYSCVFVCISEYCIPLDSSLSINARPMDVL